MIEPCPATVRFAVAVVRAELASDDHNRSSELAQRIMQRLYRPLSKLFGAVGFDVLLARSLALAQRDRPFLEEVSAGSAGTLVGLAAGAPDSALAQDTASAIVSRFVELMSLLIGEDFTLRLLRDVEPRAVKVSLDVDAR